MTVLPSNEKKPRPRKVREPTAGRRGLTENEFCARYGVGRTTAWSLRKSGVVLARRLGAEPRPDKNGDLIDHRRVFYDFDSAEAWFNGLPSNAGGAL